MTTTARPLDRRRDKAGSAGAAAAAARTAVTDIDHQLKTVANLAEQQHQALHRAVEETARLKRSLKAAGKRRTELVKERKKAVARADRARAKAAAAEAKYDKELLADLVRREKEKDRAGSSAPAPAPRTDEAAPDRASRTGRPDGAAPARASRRPAKAEPATEQPDEATQTSRRTAARKTAKAARLIR